jgi:phosphate-selective porin OprO/OprP
MGANFWHRNVDTTLQYATRPESHIAPFFVDTEETPADTSDLTVLEGAVRRGRWKLQSEFALTKVGASGRDSLTFHGFYVQGSAFLTGESYPYRSERGTFTRPHPRRSIRKGGFGALEVGFRYSRIDLSDGLIQGGILADWSAAFNWHLSYHAQLMFNAILADLEGAKPVGIFQMRLQVSF